MRKNVLITGASRGIGLAIAKSFAANQYELYLTCKNSESDLLFVKDEIEKLYKVPCHTFICDAGEYNDVKQLFENLPPLHILINNAGISYMGLLSEMSYTDWNTVMQTNLSSCFFTSKLAIPKMLSQGFGKIINISSIWGNSGASMEVAYSAAKGGVNTFTKALAKELAPSNIQVNAISCGVIDTQMNNCLSDDEKDFLKQEIPADRFGTPDEVANLAFYLATSPSYLTGQIIGLDGGFF